MDDEISTKKQDLELPCGNDPILSLMCAISVMKETKLPIGLLAKIFLVT